MASSMSSAPHPFSVASLAKVSERPPPPTRPLLRAGGDGAGGGATTEYPLGSGFKVIVGCSMHNSEVTETQMYEYSKEWVIAA